MPGNKSSIFRFADVEVREREFSLVKAGEVSAVEPKAFRVLLMLLRNPQKLISKEELLNAVWGDAAVTENSLTRSIALLRRLLGDEARDPRYIETVATVGYRWVCKVEVAEEGQGGTAAPETAPARVARPRRIAAPVLAAALIVLIAAGGLAYWRHRLVVGNRRLTEKGTIVLADFANSTGDTVFDDTLKTALSISLEQSPFLRIVPEQQVRRILQMMSQKPDARLTPEIAQEVCQRAGGAAVLNGSIAEIGTQYLLTLKALNCGSGESLASTEAQAGDKNHVLDALGKAASDIRSKLGESLSTVRKLDTPLDQATTPSLEALQAYSLGRRQLIWMDDYTAAVPLFQRAIRLDPNFAMAYLSLGISQLSLGETSLGAESIQKAYSLSERVSQWEKFAIESRYYLSAVGDLGKARQTYELWAQAYPRDSIPVRNLGEIYGALGQYDRALTMQRDGFRLDPSRDYGDLVASYLNLDRLDEARAAAEEARVKKLDSPQVHFNLFQLAFLQNDTAGMAQQAAWASGKPGVEDMFLDLEAQKAAYSGRLGKAREFSRQAVASAELVGEKETAAGYEAEEALLEALLGNMAEARQRATAVLRLSTGRDVQYLAALALALAGDAPRAYALAADLARRYPEDTVAQFSYLPTIHAQLALNRNDSSQSIEALLASSPYELGTEGNGLTGGTYLPALHPVYVHGTAYLTAHQGGEAAAEFQKILDHRAVVGSQPIGALAHLQIGRAFAMEGDLAKAKGAYQDFLTLWKDADPDIPILKEAKAEYAKLQ